MARGNEILVSANPKGFYEECVISGTPKPGTVMELKKATAVIGGRWTFEPAGTTAAVGANLGMAADGDRLAIAVLLPDQLQGKIATDAYADGDRGFLYYPVSGEELNMLLENQSGTADDFIIGSKLIVDDGTGKLLISASTVESEPFMCLEAITDMAADTLAWCKYTGH